MPQPSPPSTAAAYSARVSQRQRRPTNGSPQRMALDNIIRRELRVSDPNDPIQIAQALLTRYQDTPRAQAISQEAKGLPFLQAAPMQTLVPQATTSSDAELQQAKDDVDRDLHELTTNSLLKDVTPEIQGWGQAVRSAITEGTTAARFALDPRQRDKAFGIRRQLGDYARMARLVGALTPTLNLSYRKFAQSLDEVAAVILVTMGESLANVGFNGGRFLLQAPLQRASGTPRRGYLCPAQPDRRHAGGIWTQRLAAGFGRLPEALRSARKAGARRFARPLGRAGIGPHDGRADPAGCTRPRGGPACTRFDGATRSGAFPPHGDHRPAGSEARIAAFDFLPRRPAALCGCVRELGWVPPYADRPSAHPILRPIWNHYVGRCRPALVGSYYTAGPARGRARLFPAVRLLSSKYPLPDRPRQDPL